MNKLNSTHSHNVTPPPILLPVLEKLKTVYKLWHSYHGSIPKTQKYSLGNRIDGILVEIIEMVASAAFSNKTEKVVYIKIAIRKMGTVKILAMVLWETEGLDNDKYIKLSEILSEIGRNLGGWYGQTQKQNSPTSVGEK